jgi:hypothetical protein
VTYWKLGDRWAYITSRGKRGIVDKMSDVPSSAKTKTTGSTKKKTRKSSPKKKGGTKTVAKKNKKGRSGFKLPGGLGPKGILFGALGLTMGRRLLPTQSGGVQKTATGMGLRALKIGGGGPLAGAGLIEIAADVIEGLLSGGGLNLGIGGGTNGGTDF